jgi:hypothetical protein
MSTKGRNRSSWLPFISKCSQGLQNASHAKHTGMDIGLHVLTTIRLKNCTGQQSEREESGLLQDPVWVKVKVKLALEQTTKAQRGSTGTALLFP